MITFIIKPVPCQHIADYYRYQKIIHPSLGNNLLRMGYAQWAKGEVHNPETNNLYTVGPIIRIIHS
jgi:hypothetical protein